MIALFLGLLIILWFLGYIHISGLTIPDINLFAVNGHQITLVEVLIFLLLIGAAEALPSPFRQIAFVILVIWVLATLGILAIAGLSSILVLAVIVGLILALFGVV